MQTFEKGVANLMKFQRVVGKAGWGGRLGGCGMEVGGDPDFEANYRNVNLVSNRKLHNFEIIFLISMGALAHSTPSAYRPG